VARKYNGTEPDGAQQGCGGSGACSGYERGGEQHESPGSERRQMGREGGAVTIEPEKEWEKEGGCSEVERASSSCA
jgi:hypothetical protein